MVASGELVHVEPVDRPSPTSLVPATIRARVQSIAHAGAGPFRTARGLADAVESLSRIRKRFQTDQPALVVPQVAEWETSNVLASASVLATAALAREESRGGHQRTDFPEANDARWRVRLAATLNPDGQLEMQEVPLELM
jgi:L-aspartate oxidase